MESAPESVPGWISCHGNPLETIEQISSCANLIKQKINKRTVIKIQVFDEQKYSGQYSSAVYRFQPVASLSNSNLFGGHLEPRNHVPKLNETYYGP